MGPETPPFGTVFSFRNRSSGLLGRTTPPQGIQEIQGNLVVDGSYFQGPERHPAWDPEDSQRWFAAPVSAVSLSENLVTSE